MKYNNAPLPFTGQKRNFLKAFNQVLTENIHNEGKGWTIIDAFGGSGLLSRNAKDTLPKARVIYNDFDHYCERLNHIDDTNRLRQALFDLLKNEPTKGKLSKELKDKVLQIINQFDGFIDTQFLASAVLFSGQQISSITQLNKHALYNRVRKTDFTKADDYLDGLEVVSKDFEELITEFKGVEKTLLVLDPPYVSTNQESYKNANYFGMIDFLKLINIVEAPFIFFSSTRSEFIDYLDLIITKQWGNYQTFIDYKKINKDIAMNKSHGYEDNMVYKMK